MGSSDPAQLQQRIIELEALAEELRTPLDEQVAAIDAMTEEHAAALAARDELIARLDESSVVTPGTPVDRRPSDTLADKAKQAETRLSRAERRRRARAKAKHLLASICWEERTLRSVEPASSPEMPASTWR